MSHDPLCGLNQPCDDEIREHGYCLMSHGKFCIHCNQWCICPQLQQAKEEVAQRIIETDTLAAAAQRVRDYLQHDVADGWMSQGKADGIIATIRGEK